MAKGQKNSIKDCLEDLPEDKLGQYKKGYEDGKEEFLKDIQDKNCVEPFIEGYKAGYRDGYMALMKDIIKETGQAQVDGEGQPGWPWPPRITFP